MHRTRWTAVALIVPAIAALGIACDRTTPTETLRPGAAQAAPTFNHSDDGDDGDRRGEGFRLGGTARHAQDPENPANDVIRISTELEPGQCVAPAFENCPSGTVSRTVNVQIAKLDNMIEFKAYFVAPKTCIGGSPRIQLAIDLNGDGVSDGNAHGNFGPGPFGTGCAPAGVWDYQDLTDLAPRWDVTQLTGVGEIPTPLPGNVNPFLVPWDLLETLVSMFPNHQVCTVALVDDTFGAPGMSGIAYYDLFSAGRETWVDRSDTRGRGFARGCRRADRDEDDDNDR